MCLKKVQRFRNFEVVPCGQMEWILHSSHPANQSYRKLSYFTLLTFLCLQGNMEKDFVYQRTYMLDNFLKELAKQRYLVFSQEFTLFTELTGDELKLALKVLE